MTQTQGAIALLRNRRIRTTLLIGALMLISLPALVTAGVSGLIAQQSESACGSASDEQLERPAGAAVTAGLYAMPLELRPGRWYEVGATRYGGTEDPGSGLYGSIANRGESYLPAHPNSFAELSVLDSNPANGGAFSFNDANALNNLAYLTQLYEPLNQLSHVGATLTGAGAGTRRVFEILDSPEEVKEAPAPRSVARFLGSGRSPTASQPVLADVGAG